MHAPIKQWAILYVVPVVAATALAASPAANRRGGAGEPAENTTQLTALWTLSPCDRFDPSQLETCAQTIAARLEVWNIPCSVAASTKSITVKMALSGTVHPLDGLRKLLTDRGGFAIHDVVDVSSDKQAAPEGYVLPRWALEVQKGDRPMFISKEPVFTALPPEPPTVLPQEYKYDGPHISLPLATEDRQRFAELTEKRVGRRLALVIDGEVWIAPVVRARIFGDIAIYVDTTEEEAWLLAGLAGTPPLGLCLRVEDEREIDEIWVPPPPPTAREPIVDAGALELFNALVVSRCDVRPPPAAARIRFRCAATFDPEAEVEYLWRAPDAERVRTRISCLRAVQALNGGSPSIVPADTAIAFLEGRRESLLETIRLGGRMITGASSIGLGELEGMVPLMDALSRPEELIDAKQVDLLLTTINRGDILTVSGVEYGRYQRQELILMRMAQSQCLDSVAVFSPEIEIHIRIHREVMDGVPMITDMWYSTGIPGDSRRHETRLQLTYRPIEGALLMTKLTFERNGASEVGFEVIGIETGSDIGIDLDAVDWADRIEFVDQDKLREADKLRSDR